MTPAAIQKLIVDLVGSFVERPDKVTVNVLPYMDDVCFELESHLEDESRIVGQGGSHIKALVYLVDRMGKAHSRTFVLKFVTHGRFAGRRAQVKAVDDFDPAECLRLLIEVMKALELAVHVGVEQDGRTDNGQFLFFVFKIQALSYKVAQILFVPDDPEYSDRTVLAAIGTLYRAIARQNGVAFEIEVEQ